MLCRIQAFPLVPVAWPAVLLLRSIQWLMLARALLSFLMEYSGDTTNSFLLMVGGLEFR